MFHAFLPKTNIERLPKGNGRVKIEENIKKKEFNYECRFISTRNSTKNQVTSPVYAPPRAVACTRLIEPFGFIWDDRHFAGTAFDYWALADIQRYLDFEAFAKSKPEG